MKRLSIHDQDDAIEAIVDSLDAAGFDPECSGLSEPDGSLRLTVTVAQRRHRNSARPNRAHPEVW